jgi:hypothetical protein
MNARRFTGDNGLHHESRQNSCQPKIPPNCPEFALRHALPALINVKNELINDDYDLIRDKYEFINVVDECSDDENEFINAADECSDDENELINAADECSDDENKRIDAVPLCTDDENECQKLENRTKTGENQRFPGVQEGKNAVSQPNRQKSGQVNPISGQTRPAIRRPTLPRRPRNPANLRPCRRCFKSEALPHTCRHNV